MSSARLSWIAAILLAASPARAIQPLEVFVAAARDRNPDADEARMGGNQDEIIAAVGKAALRAQIFRGGAFGKASAILSTTLIWSRQSMLSPRLGPISRPQEPKARSRQCSKAGPCGSPAYWWTKMPGVFAASI